MQVVMYAPPPGLAVPKAAAAAQGICPAGSRPGRQAHADPTPAPAYAAGVQCLCLSAADRDKGVLSLPYCVTERCMRGTTPCDRHLQVCMAAATAALTAASWLRAEDLGIIQYEVCHFNTLS